MSDDDKVVRLKVDFKTPISEEKILTLVPQGQGCSDHSYVIDPETDTVACIDCKKTFTPMAVLLHLAKKESRWHKRIVKYRGEVERLSKRMRTKCDNCGQMTNISKR